MLYIGSCLSYLMAPTTSTQTKYMGAYLDFTCYRPGLLPTGPDSHRDPSFNLEDALSSRNKMNILLDRQRNQPDRKAGRSWSQKNIRSVYYAFTQ